VVDFKGTRFGIKIDDGKGYTDDETKARACAACGYKVIDRQTGEPAVFDDGGRRREVACAVPVTDRLSHSKD
jgi:hypothetical protein